MEDFLIDYGIWAIAFFVLGDDLGLPFFPPGTMIFAYVAFAKINPEISLFPIILVALIIPPCANYILFFAGKHGLRHYLDTHGHKFFLPEHRIKKAEKILEKHGEKTIFFAACWSTIRPFCSLVAGSLGMNSFKFMGYHFLGVCVWAGLLIGGGHFLGKEFWEIIETHWFYFVIGLGSLIPAYFYWSAYFKRKK